MLITFAFRDTKLNPGLASKCNENIPIFMIFRIFEKYAGKCNGKYATLPDYGQTGVHLAGLACMSGLLALNGCGKIRK